jgi:hypothetical protein
MGRRVLACVCACVAFRALNKALARCFLAQLLELLKRHGRGSLGAKSQQVRRVSRGAAESCAAKRRTCSCSSTCTRRAQRTASPAGPASCFRWSVAAAALPSLSVAFRRGSGFTKFLPQLDAQAISEAELGGQPVLRSVRECYERTVARSAAADADAPPNAAKSHKSFTYIQRAGDGAAALRPDEAGVARTVTEHCQA